PLLPAGSRRSVPPAMLTSLDGEFVAEVGVGIVHHAAAHDAAASVERTVALSAAVRHEFDPTGRLNPGVDV
ncbi:MAG: FAD-binding oxidoreductase, partial [Ilumatobacteraceae bacterium]